VATSLGSDVGRPFDAASSSIHHKPSIWTTLPSPENERPLRPQSSGEPLDQYRARPQSFPTARTAGKGDAFLSGTPSHIKVVVCCSLRSRPDP